ncbi:MAG: branched-chain amino acid ABC transporter substrate-binding protein [Intrasporangium sp.]|uniref:branched-chain amino acid ABC transporter substrate-binding protein n=1 Tax=Intrasporangium sp. TaxID=1925024 RepID=UPI002647300E|nr:branched-chain amino acid ABC transporter substrate-binding protein [Intrasporangium sp.]MDN5795192.1 branched-chain amino acid ABC transporter substrate-binding protein [Intrasporangium sp.]
MMRTTRVGAVAAAAGAVLALTSCGGGGITGDSGSGGGDTGDIVLGMVTPLSGSSAAIGPYMKNGAQLAVNEANEAGGVIGRQVKLVAEDGACDPKTAAAAAAKLVTAGTNVSVGGYCSSATLPTLSIFGKANIPMIIPAANSNDLLKDQHKNVFLLNGTGAQQAQAALDFMKKSGAKAIALVDDNTSYSKDITTRTAEDAKGDSALKVVSRESVTAGESDYSAAVTAILRANPDFVYWTGYYQEGGLLIKQLRAAGYKGDVMVADGSVDKQLITIAGKDNAQGVFATMTQTPQTIPGGDAWIAKYKKAFNADPGPYSTQSYDAVRVAVEAIKNAGSTDGTKVITALQAIDGFPIFSGKLKFTPEHTLSEGGFDILVVKGDGFVLNK